MDPIFLRPQAQRSSRLFHYMTAAGRARRVQFVLEPEPIMTAQFSSVLHRVPFLIHSFLYTSKYPMPSGGILIHIHADDTQFCIELSIRGIENAKVHFAHCFLIILYLYNPAILRFLQFGRFLSVNSLRQTDSVCVCFNHESDCLTLLLYIFLTRN